MQNLTVENHVEPDAACVFTSSKRILQWCLLHYTAPSGSKSTAWAVKQSLTVSLHVCCLHVFTIRTCVFNKSAHKSSHPWTYNVTHVISMLSSVWYSQDGYFHAVALSALIQVLHYLFSCCSPAQLFAVTETLSISQATSCLIYELPQRCDSHTLAHGFFCFSLHICKKLHFLPFSFLLLFLSHCLRWFIVSLSKCKVRYSVNFLNPSPLTVWSWHISYYYYNLCDYVAHIKWKWEKWGEHRMGERE